MADWRWADAVRWQPRAVALSDHAHFVWPGDLMANSAASLRGPVSDYVRFLDFAMRDQEHGGALTPATRQAMFSPQFPVRAGWIDKGLGWNLERVGQERWCWHGGANAGRYKTYVVGDPQRRRGIAVMTNGGGGTPVYQRIVRNAIARDLLAFDI
jgi:CubicO group peptidase (beta-lactamase class C family)